MAPGSTGNGDVEAGTPPWSPGGGARDSGMEARVARLEASVGHIQGNLTDIRAALARLEVRVAEIVGNLPHLATKAELGRRPTIAGIIAIVALIAAIASIPIWPEWAAAIKAIAAAGRH